MKYLNFFGNPSEKFRESQYFFIKKLHEQYSFNRESLELLFYKILFILKHEWTRVLYQQIYFYHKQCLLNFKLSILLDQSINKTNFFFLRSNPWIFKFIKSLLLNTFFRWLVLKFHWYSDSWIWTFCGSLVK